MPITQEKTGTEIFSASRDTLRIDLLKSLCRDLNQIGHGAKVNKTAEHYALEFDAVDFDKLTTPEIRKIYDHIRCWRLEPESVFIRKMEEKGVLDLLIDGKNLNPELIKPAVQICQTATEKNYYRYFRNLQTVPNSPGFGRRIWALIFDEGQESKPLMAILGLSSTFYSLKDRDAYFGWNQIDSKLAAREIRENGLRRIMQLSVCMAVPPYNFLHGGKLAALLALSTPLQDEFRSRYNGEPLLALVTTSALSEHAPIFNRLNPRQFTNDRYSRYNNEMYRRIGTTSEYSTVMISNRTLELCRKALGPQLVTERKTGSHREGRSRIVQRALNQCGVGKSVFRLVPKGLYVGFIHERNLSLLKSGRGGSSSAVRVFDANDCIDYWKRKWLPKGIKDSNRQKIIQAFKSKHAAVGACLTNGALSSSAKI